MECPAAQLSSGRSPLWLWFNPRGIDLGAPITYAGHWQDGAPAPLRSPLLVERTIGWLGNFHQLTVRYDHLLGSEGGALSADSTRSIAAYSLSPTAAGLESREAVRGR